LSNGSTRKHFYDYAYQFSANYPYSTMIEKNMYNSLIMERIFNDVAGFTQNDLLGVTRTDYNGWNGNTLFLPQYQKSAVRGGPLEIDATIQAYDPKGNILQYTTKNGVIHTFLWGYKNEFPVLKVVGASYNDVMNAFTSLNGATIQDKYNNLQLINTDTELSSKLNEVRGSLSGNPTVQVFSYTYKIFAGVSSQTDPNGKKMTYEYDLFNRLQNIKDHNGNIVQNFCYSYAGSAAAIPCGLSNAVFYNAANSGVFTKVCPNGELGTQVTYLVRAGKHSAATQTAADQLAWDDIAANGQAYANANGTCRVTGCTTGNCNGPDLKCINGYCEKAKKKRMGYYCNGTIYQIIYRYEWSDGTFSAEFTENGGLCNSGGPSI
jgi:YD repeat-containing protein